MPQTAAQRYRDHIGHLEFLAETQILAEPFEEPAAFDDEEGDAIDAIDDKQAPATRYRITAPRQEAHAPHRRRR